MESEFVVYNCTLSSVTSHKCWTVSYRYSEFVDFKTKLDSDLTCQDANCSGSCQGLRDIVSVYFPKKRLPFMSKKEGATTSRKHKFEYVLIHLLRSILLPGSVMKCMYARQNLPTNVFDFLGVEDAADRRSLLQIFVDHYQDVIMSNQRLNTRSVDSSETTQCTICLNNVGLEQDESDTDDSEEESSQVIEEGNDATDDRLVKLPCQHAFHRKCIFQWLLFEFHCPVCRVGLCPTAWTSKCRPQKHEQWWLSDFDKDFLHGCGR